jgi:hypothetical protein
MVPEPLFHRCKHHRSFSPEQMNLLRHIAANSEMKVLLKDMAGESNIQHRAASDPPCSLKSGTHYLHRTFESRRHNSMA